MTVEGDTIEMAIDGSTVKIGGQAVMTCSWTYTDLLSTVVSVSQILGERLIAQIYIRKLKSFIESTLSVNEVMR